MEKGNFIWIRHNPLKSLDSTKGIQGNPSLFLWGALGRGERNYGFFVANGLHRSRDARYLRIMALVYEYFREYVRRIGNRLETCLQR
jgi:hypothetical protein